ncbi:IclR family transcriptional regulator [Mycobacterium sp. 21AC1]|uniref:IclR family transcriptional regulator n=1 Tax=[Mycobacterium] appelbergii TaxID=2939269 RepID=UPI002939247A|nr:IclR family transcriptional regulator [Mycobacterium sp. 21AC1]MDV3128376.1 IclR family transcriptional regulator [Mycobacterium sp. 21AC1]
MVMAEESSVRVLERACQVLDCFTADAPRLKIADLRQLTGLPATTVARIVKTLVSQDLLDRDGDEYRLGLRVLVWSAPATVGSDVIAAAGPVVEQVRDLTHETSGLYVRQGASRVTVAAELSTYSVVYRAYVGQVRPLHAGAAGKVFMAADGAALDAALKKGLSRFTPSTTCDPEALQRELDLVRDQGWAFAAEEIEVGLNSVAAPVYGATGAVVGVLACGGPSLRLTAESADEYGPMLAAIGLALSKRLGYTHHLDAIVPGSRMAE